MLITGGSPQKRARQEWAALRIIIEKFHKESMGGMKPPQKIQKAANGFDRRKTDRRQLSAAETMPVSVGAIWRPSGKDGGQTADA